MSHRHSRPAPRRGRILCRGLAALVVALVLLAGIERSGGAAITKNARSYAAGKYALELDGIQAGWLHSAEGGHATADVIAERLGADGLQKKHLGPLKYEDITVACGVGTVAFDRNLAEWIQGTLALRYTRKNGAIIAADYNYKEHSRLNFANALITEVGFPALDAASKDAAKMTIKLSPEITRFTTMSGKLVQAKKQKAFLPSNFRVVIDNLDCSRVMKVDSFTIKQSVIHVAGATTYVLEVPHLAMTLAEPSASSFAAWHADFVIKGNSGEKLEKSGSLIYLDADGRTPLFGLKLSNLGIFNLAPEKSEGTTARVKIELYCESMELIPSPTPPGG